VAGLARRIGLAGRDVVAALWPALLLTGLALVASALCLRLLGSGLTALALACALTLLLGAALLRWRRAALLQPSLRRLLQARAAQSPAAARACAALGWQPRPEA